MRYQITTQSGVREYNPDRNYNVNDVVSIGTEIYQNVTGFQTNPQTDTVNWLKIKADSSGAIITSANATFQDLAATDGYKSSIAPLKNIVICSYQSRLLQENSDFTYTYSTGVIELIGDFKTQVLAEPTVFSPLTLNFKIQ